MTAILVLGLLGCSVWVLATLRRREHHNPHQSVEGFHRALEALEPETRPARRR